MNNPSVQSDATNKQSAWYCELTKSPEVREARWRARRLILSVAVFLLVANLYAPAKPQPVQRILGSLIILLGLLPAVRWVLAKDKNLPFLAIIGFLYTLSFGIPVFVRTQFTLSWYTTLIIADDAITKAQVLTVVGLFALYIGYYGRLSTHLAHTAPKVTLDWSEQRVDTTIAIILAIVGASVNYLNFRQVSFGGEQLVSNGAESLVHGLSMLNDFGIVMLLILQFTGGLSRRAAVVFWGILLPFRLIVIDVASSSFTESAMVSLTMVMIFAAIRRRFPWPMLVCGVAIYIFIHPVKTIVRTETGTLPVSATPLQRIELTAAVVKRVMLGKDSPFGEGHLIEASLDRLNDLTLLADLITETPARVGYWNGYSYIPLLWKLVPVAIYPGKPQEDTGQVFPHRYGLLKRDDTTTAVVLPQLVEGYINFGFVGVFFAMLFCGLLYRVVEGIFFHPNMSYGSLVAVSFIFERWFSIDHTFSQVIGSLPLSALIIVAVNILVRASERLGADRSNTLRFQRA